MPALFLAPFLTGFGISFGLIVAIGAQNAYVLRLGLRRQHVFPVTLFCAAADAVLIALGIAGLGQVIAAYPAMLMVVTGFGALFLLAYGIRAAQRAWHPAGMALDGAEANTPLKEALLACFAFTFLNPHVYLDTVILVGGLGARYPGGEKLAFGLGAASASFVWFFALGYGARLLAPVFTRPLAWRVLDALIAFIMLLIAGRLMLWMVTQG